MILKEKYKLMRLVAWTINHVFSEVFNGGVLKNIYLHSLNFSEFRTGQVLGFVLKESTT